MTFVVDLSRQSEQYGIAAKSANGIATLIKTQALNKPRQFLIAVFSMVERVGKLSSYPLLWAGLQIPLARPPRNATSCGRLNDNHRRLIA